MDTHYEVWLERDWKEVTEKVAVPVDPKDPSKGQKIGEKKTRLEGTVIEPLLGDDDAPMQSTNKDEMERRAVGALNEEGIVRTCLREIRTVAEFRPKEKSATAQG